MEPMVSNWRSRRSNRPVRPRAAGLLILSGFLKAPPASGPSEDDTLYNRDP
jgi:hypothetical protein